MMCEDIPNQRLAPYLCWQFREGKQRLPHICLSVGLPGQLKRTHEHKQTRTSGWQIEGTEKHVWLFVNLVSFNYLFYVILGFYPLHHTANSFQNRFSKVSTDSPASICSDGVNVSFQYVESHRKHLSSVLPYMYKYIYICWHERLHGSHFWPSTSLEWL